MTILTVILLALVEGAAATMLLSGSGQLILFAKLTGVTETKIDLLLFCVILHAGNLIGTLLYERKNVAGLLRELPGLLGRRSGRPAQGVRRRELMLLLVALLPMALTPLLFGTVRGLYSGEQLLLWSGVGLGLSGLFLFFGERLYRGSRDEKTVTALDALLIGLSQVLAVFPGVSRSALTVGTGVMRGLKREYAVTFSCLLSLPVLLAALVTELIRALSGAELPSIWLCLPGIVLSAAASWFFRRLLTQIAKYGRFDSLAYICWGTGVLSLLLVLVA